MAVLTEKAIEMSLGRQNSPSNPTIWTTNHLTVATSGYTALWGQQQAASLKGAVVLPVSSSSFRLLHSLSSRAPVDCNEASCKSMLPGYGSYNWARCCCSAACPRHPAAHWQQPVYFNSTTQFMSPCVPYAQPCRHMQRMCSDLPPLLHLHVLVMRYLLRYNVSYAQIAPVAVGPRHDASLTGATALLLPFGCSCSAATHGCFGGCLCEGDFSTRLIYNSICLKQQGRI